VLLKRRSEKGRDESAGLAKRKIEGGSTGRDAMKQLGKAREGRGDEIVERSESGLNRHAQGLRDGASSGNG
jgi:hypothetical protein